MRAYRSSMTWPACNIPQNTRVRHRRVEPKSTAWKVSGLPLGAGAPRPPASCGNIAEMASWVVGAVLLLGPALCACAHRSDPRVVAAGPPAVVSESAPGGDVQEGWATWYGGKLAGRKTASGERFDPSQMIAAHRSLPFGTWVEVRRVDTAASVRVRITDRGPFGHEERIIDLSRGAAEKIGLVRAGLAKVELRIVDGP